MNGVLLQGLNIPERGELRIAVDLTVQINISAEEARRKVHRFVSDNVSYLMGGESPTLLLIDKQVLWRVPVMMTYPSYGRLGTVGAIDVSAESGEMLVTDDTIRELQDNGKALGARFTSKTET